MKLKDKIALCSGKDMWHTKDFKEYNIQSIMMCDGPHGLRKQEGSGDILGINNSCLSTSFPTSVSVACSFDTDLVELMGKTIGEEASAMDVQLVLGPGANIKRNPLCGRNFEYYSEDPYLTGKMAASFIKGVESTGTGSTLKHFAFNNQEYKRFVSNSIVDERAMREIYLTGFEMAIKEGKPSAVMSSYNKINGVSTSASKWLLNDVLREEWKFDGFVMTDWGGITNRIESFKAGCDLVMPGGSCFQEKETYQAVVNHELDEKYIDQSVNRIIKFVNKERNHKYNLDLDKHYEIAKKIAVESAVLLKNDDHLLPINEDSVLFIGHMAKQIRYQGSGSSHINPYKLVNVIDACPNIDYIQGYNEDGTVNLDLLNEAITKSKEYQNIVIFAGLSDSYESEGFDRESMKMPIGHNTLIEEITKVNKNVIVVLMSGSAIEIPWMNDVKSILYMGLSGEAAGDAIKELIFGYTSPCGKLAESWPLSYEDCISSSYYGTKDAQYRESIYVGYRYYSTVNKKVAYPFGHGLSYTTFEYSNIQIKEHMVTCNIKNIGTIKAKEIVQLYIEGCNKEIHRPKLELKGFKKIELEPNETKTVSFELNERMFSIWNQGWIIPNGEYKIHIGKSCEDLQLTTMITIQNNQYEIRPEQDWYKTLKGIPTQEMFERQIKTKIIENKPIKGEYTMANTILEMSETSKVMKFIHKLVEFIIGKFIFKKIDYSNPTFKMMMTTSMDASLNGLKVNVRLNNYLLEGLVEIANGHFINAVKTIIRNGGK